MNQIFQNRKYKKLKLASLLILLIVMNVLTSYLVFIFLTKGRMIAYFKDRPREENESYGFFEVDSKDYFQIYTTTQVKIDNDLHYHKIDIRGNLK